MDDRSETTLGLRWEDGADPGGVPVIDYTVTVTDPEGNYDQIFSNVVGRHFVPQDLTLGVIYSFEV